jgi:hypothetical protein
MPDTTLPTPLKKFNDKNDDLTLASSEKELQPEPEPVTAVAEKPAQESKPGPGPPPDGGLRAWLVVLGVRVLALKCCQ